MPEENVEKTAPKKQSHPMDGLMSQSMTKPFPRVGEFVTGTVIQVGKHEVIIDIPGLTTGIVRGWEIVDASGDMSDLKVGDEVQATVIDLENERGMMELSFRIAGHRKAWDNLNKIRTEGEIVEVKALEANKGGLIVELGRVLGFLPVSQLAPEHYPRVEGGNKTKILDKLKELVGVVFKVKIIDIDEADEKLIVSEKAVEEDKHVKALVGYSVGDEIEVKISGIVDFGLFVEIPAKDGNDEHGINSVEGLIHISEISWQRVDDLREKFSIGDVVKAQIIEIKNAKVSLSLKRLLDDPWKKATEYYSVGQIVKGKVTKVSDFGAFVELQHDIHGLAHISELAISDSEDPKQSVQVGSEYEFKIVNMEPEEHRLGLSRRAAVIGDDGGENKSSDENKSANEGTEQSGEEKANDSSADASEDGTSSKTSVATESVPVDTDESKQEKDA